MRAALLSTIAATALACSSSSGSGAKAPTESPPPNAVVDAGSPEAPVSERERKARTELEKLRTAVCQCSSKGCADRYVAALYSFMLANKTRSFSKRGVAEVGAVSEKMVDCATAKGTDRAVIGRLLHAAALAIDPLDEIERLRDVACDCKAVTCSETVLSTYALYMYVNAGRRVKADEASRIGGAANALQNCMRSVGLPDARIQATLKKALKR